MCSSAPSLVRSRAARAAALALVLLSCSGGARVVPAERAPSPPDAASRTGAPPGANPFVHAVGPDLFDGEGRKVLLKGIAFGNDVWYQRATVPVHAEADYQRCRDLGVNAIRFYLDHRWLERRPFSYDDPGFERLARNVASARASGIRLLLNMHVPPGGYQSDGGGRALWTDRENQRRFVALWREIARRFKDEPGVLGYDLLNEPVVTSSVTQWEALARETVAAIREVDPAHLVVVERVNGVYRGGWLRPRPRPGDWNPDRNGAMNFVTVNDTNIAYEFHFYQPFQFTLLGWPFERLGAGDVEGYPGTYLDWDGQRRRFDRAYLAALLERVLAVQRRDRVPLYLGEFGVNVDVFDDRHNARGWVSDVIDLALAHGIGVDYHSYDDLYLGLNSHEGYNVALGALLAEKFR